MGEFMFEDFQNFLSNFGSLKILTLRHRTSNGNRNDNSIYRP